VAGFSPASEHTTKRNAWEANEKPGPRCIFYIAELLPQIFNDVTQHCQLRASLVPNPRGSCGVGGSDFGLLSPRFQLLSKAGQRVKAIDTIGTVIHKVNQIAGTIAAAVEEQDATTNEMSRNVAEAARASEEISQYLWRSRCRSKHEPWSGRFSAIGQGASAMSSQLRELVGQFQTLAL
jgi:hypothetical protein